MSLNRSLQELNNQCIKLDLLDAVTHCLKISGAASPYKYIYIYIYIYIHTYIQEDSDEPQPLAARTQ